MNTPVREGETIEGSRTMRNRPYPVLKCSSLVCMFAEKTVIPLYMCHTRGREPATTKNHVAGDGQTVTAHAWRRRENAEKILGGALF